MFNIISEFIEYLFTGIWAGISAFLKVLPLYEQLSGIKEEIIAAGLGVPAIIVSIVFAIPTIVGLSAKIIDRFL